jgi:hypothetical protein
MNSILNVVTNTVKRDGLVRTATWDYNQPLYNKALTFSIPNYCVQISNSSMINMVDIRLELDHLLGDHSKTYHVKIFDVDTVLLDRVQNNQLDLGGKYINEKIREFFYKNLMILDFCSESFNFTKYLKKLSTCRRLPKEVLDLAMDLSLKYEKIKQSQKFADYRDNKLEIFWDSILSSDRKLLDFEARIHKQGIASSGDIVLPFTKLIKNKRDILDVERINTAWMYLNKVEEKPSVAYIVISLSALRNTSTVETIIDYISRLNADILVMKVKNLKLTDPSSNAKQRELFAKILKQISKKKQENENFLTIFLEAGDHIFPLSVQAFDIVSTSSSLFDIETSSGGSAKDGYGGKAIDEEKLGLLGFDDWQEEFNRIGEFPCTHDFCRSRIATMKKPEYTQWQWYIDLRRHNILTLTDWMRMIGESVVNQMADLAVNRIRNSPYTILSELLVRNYDDPTEHL